MKCLVIGGNRFVGLRLTALLDKVPNIDLHILNRTGQAPHCKNAVVHKGDRSFLTSLHLDQDWDVIYDFACYSQGQAEAAVAFFKNVGRYIFISTTSIYDSGDMLKESAFQAETFDLLVPPKTNDYQDGKRRCERVFSSAHFPTLSVRFPFILGPDDYTERLSFHVENVLRGDPIYIPNPAARISMIHSEDAARFLFWAHSQSVVGPLNVACAQSISLSELLAQIQLVTSDTPVLAKTETAENHSPYGVPSSLTVDVSRLISLGFIPRKLSEWLPNLIGQPSTIDRKGYVH